MKNKKLFRVIIAGSRSFNNRELLESYCDRILTNKNNIEIVSGTARGADKLGEDYAHKKEYKLKLFPAEWDKYGKSAGYRRNAEMANYADALIAFWDGQSKGTKHMIDLAKENDLKIRVCYYEK